MGTLLSELASKEILPGTAVWQLREYIKRKYPALSPVKRAGVFADAVNRIIEGKLPQLPSDRVGQFKAYLYGSAVKKKTFSIDGSDIFKSTLRLKIDDDRFIKGMRVWLEKMLQTPVSEEKVSQYVFNVNRLLDQIPGMDIEKAVESAEASIGDIRPQRRVISLFRITSSPAGTQDVTGSADAGAKAFGGEREGLEIEQMASGYEHEASDYEQIFSESYQKASGYEEIFSDNELIAPGSYKIAAGGRQEADEVRQEEADLWRDVAIIRKKVREDKKAPASLRDTVRGCLKNKKVISAGLAAAAVLCVYFSALYVNYARNTEAADSGVTVADEGIPAGSTVLDGGIDGTDNGMDPGNENISPGSPIKMKATAYDLSVESCGKDRDDPGYGITKTGTRAKAGRTIAVDPEVIPLGSSVMITFPDEYSHLNGIYVAEDTGRLIVGNCIDIFFGEDEPGKSEINQKALEFGVQYVDVIVLGEDEVSR